MKLQADELQKAIHSMFETKQGKIVLEALNEKLKEPSYTIGEPSEAAIYREGSRRTLAWLIESHETVKKGQ
ncbi:MAG: hypothetical protein WBG43_13070 [Marinifilaceae bacterium]